MRDNNSDQGFNLRKFRSSRVLILVVAIAAIVISFSIYFTQTCCSFDLNHVVNDIKPVHIESNKEHVDTNRVKDSPLTGNQLEMATRELSRPVIESDFKPVEVSVSVSVSGQIYTDTGLHSSNDRVTLYSPSQNEKHITKSNADGYFRLNKVTASDDYELRITPRGLYRQHYERVSVTPPYSQFHIQLRSRPVNTLRGQVLNLNNIPVPDFRFKIRSQDTIKWEGAVTSDSIGSFELANVPVGVLTFYSTHDGIVLSISGYELQSGQPPYLHIIVDQGSHTISGIVFDQYGELAIGASVIVDWEYLDGNKRASVSRRTATRQDGTFYLAGLGPGQHVLTVADLTNGTTHKQVLNLSSDFEELLIYLK